MPRVFSAVARACPVCGGEEGTSVCDVEQDVCGIGRINFGIRCCSGCGMLLQDPVTSPEVIETQYTAYSNYAFVAPPVPPLIDPYRRIIAALKEAAVPPGKAYDVGAAMGELLYYLRENGWEVAGCDPSPKAVAAGRNAYGIDLVAGWEGDILPKLSGLNLVVFSHVLEHLIDPLAVLERCHRALAPGGHLAFEVPCFVDPESMPPGIFMMEHLNYFSEQTAERMVRSAGFEPVTMRVSFWENAYPVITVLARKRDGGGLPAGFASAFDEVLPRARRYVELESRLWSTVNARIAAGVPDGVPAIIYGAGLHTSCLLERTDLLKRAKVVAVVDRDPQKHGQVLGDLAVRPVSVVKDVENGKIVISSYSYERDIVRDLLGIGVSRERIVTLYN